MRRSHICGISSQLVEKSTFSGASIVYVEPESANPKLYRAYLLKENLRLALKASPDEIA